MRISMLVGVAMAIALGAGAAQAQIGGFPGGRGGFGGRGGMGEGRGRGGPRYNMRPQAEVPDLSNPVKFILLRKDSLKLSADEVQRVDSVARLVDKQNDTLIAQVKRAFPDDSAALSNGGRVRIRRSGGESDGPLGDGEDVALQDRIKVLKPTFDAIKKNNDAGWKSATALITKDQKKQAERMRSDEDKQRQQERQRWQRRSDPGGDGPGGY